MRAATCFLIMLVLGGQVAAAEPVPPKAAPGEAQAGADRTLIATVFGQPVYLDQVTPAEAEVKRQELPRAEFGEWLLAYRGRQIYQMVWGHVLRKYIEREKIGVSEEELAAIAASVERRLALKPEPPSDTEFTPEQRKGVMIAWSRGSFMDWKICKSLHAKYGGRVGIGSLGAWIAFDGQNTLIRGHHKAGDFKFQHAESEAAFWQHTKIKNFADAYPTGERLQQLLATPPYLQD